jgi:hypothetical protein
MEAGTDFANVKPFWKTFSIYGGLTIYKNFVFTKGGDVLKMKWQSLMFLHYFIMWNLALILSLKTCSEYILYSLNYFQTYPNAKTNILKMGLYKYNTHFQH